jgi:hypothetical protein
MALLHEATISPRKDELISPWLRARRWWDGIDDRGPVGDFRLDDPAGEVGIQCFLFGSADGSTLFVPVTYRDAPRPDAETSLIGTMQHSVLGKRWVYDGCADPVFVATLVGVIRDGGREAALRLRRSDGTVVMRESTATARGDGSASVPQLEPAGSVSANDAADRTVIRADGLILVIARHVGTALPPGPSLIGAFAGGTELRLATITLRTRVSI